MKDVRTEQESARAQIGEVVAHPIRARALNILAERTASPTEIAHEIRAPVGNVAYHVRKLLALQAIELVDERKVRGSVEHFYRARVLPYVSEEAFAALSPEQQDDNTTYILQLALARIATAIDAGTFNRRPERYLTRIPALLDEHGWREMRDLHAELFERTMDIKAASAGRLAADPGTPTISAMQVAMFFEEP